MNSDLVKLWSKVVHPVANNPLPDELALPFKPDLQLLVQFLLLFFQGSSPVWILLVQRTFLLVVVKFHVLVQSLEQASVRCSL